MYMQNVFLCEIYIFFDVIIQLHIRKYPHVHVFKMHSTDANGNACNIKNS